jgi:hypothetical protein
MGRESLRISLVSAVLFNIETPENIRFVQKCVVIAEIAAGWRFCQRLQFSPNAGRQIPAVSIDNAP